MESNHLPLPLSTELENCSRRWEMRRCHFLQIIGLFLLLVLSLSLQSSIHKITPVWRRKLALRPTRRRRSASLIFLPPPLPHCRLHCGKRGKGELFHYHLAQQSQFPFLLLASPLVLWQLERANCENSKIVVLVPTHRQSCQVSKASAITFPFHQFFGTRDMVDVYIAFPRLKYQIINDIRDTWQLSAACYCPLRIAVPRSMNFRCTLLP